MRAILVQEDRLDSVPDYPDPEPARGEILIELKCAAINRRDLLMYGDGALYSFPTPFVPGSDGAGNRCDTGADVIIFPSLEWGDERKAARPGWRILGGPDDGTYAELVKVPAENVFNKPPRLSWEEAAALPLAGLTAYRALFTVGNLREHDTVLILGAGSGVSTLAVQLANQAGAYVYVTSSTEAKLEHARELGSVAGFNYTSTDWVQGVLDLTDGVGVDLVLDSVGATWMESCRCVRKGGAVVVFGATGGKTVELNVRDIYLNWLSILGTTMGSASDFAELLHMVDRGTWRPTVDSVWPLADAKRAHERMRAREHFGKLVLAINE